MNKVLRLNFVLGFFFLFLIGISTQSFAVWEESLKYVDFYKNSDMSSHKISYAIYPTKDFNGEGVFNLEVFLNGTSFSKCSQDFELTPIEPYTKVICEVEVVDSGDLTFVANVYQDDRLIQEVVSKEYLFLGDDIEVNYIENENSTTVEIYVDTNVSTKIIQEIPKSVIALVTPENRDEVLVSNLEYEIIEEDPIIAWNVENSPTKINYTINKKLTAEEKTQMKLKVEENKSFKWMIYVAILVVLLLLFSPIFFKKKRK